ncbi:hypothetical protein DS884_16385 [Tenacibaculum sp. E3R01]|uniref:hypothetical protein n=1 Tax=Tenacibaculum sp. E3R01 TaxID=2267227 RepID=UPI000DEB0C75|nr:hypothetical protein [Tenacibaculum sp. E3R01]RBW55207.1 hypothetical protein DS884_16385 [Tenacibaculum sp. E3R01]
METRLYKCEYCRKEFLPVRRRVQKYCSNSCRSKSHHQKVKSGDKIGIDKPENKTNKTSIEKLSVAGVGNAAIGSAAVDLLKYAFTKEENKPATKSDIKNLAKKLKRYHVINNMKPNFMGQLAYFDIELSVVIYK